MNTPTGGKAIAIAMAAIPLLIAAPLAAQTANGVGSPFELAFWQSVAGSDDPAVYEAYLQQYPAGTFAGLAKAKVASLHKTLPAVSNVPSDTAVATPVRTPVVAVAAATQPAPAPPRAESPSPATDSALLAQLARSQEPDAGNGKPVVAAPGFAIPQRPALNDVADLVLPPSFCSAEQRNSFYETRYKPLLELARGNNNAAIAHMQKLQQAYDSYQLSRDPAPMNALAAEARDYQQQVAAVTYSRQAAVVRQFDAVMAVPVAPCQITVAAK